MNLGFTQPGVPIDHTGAVVLIVAAALVTLLVAFFARTRLPQPLVVTALLLCGAAIGLGAAGFERGGLFGAERPYGAERIAAIVILAVLTPLHARVVLGPLGKKV